MENEKIIYGNRSCSTKAFIDYGSRSICQWYLTEVYRQDKYPKYKYFANCCNEINSDCYQHVKNTKKGCGFKCSPINELEVVLYCNRESNYDWVIGLELVNKSCSCLSFSKTNTATEC